MPAFSSYEVKRGDSLWKISRLAYGTGTRWPEIQAANARVLKRGTMIYRGQVLHIPAADAYSKFVQRGVTPGPYKPPTPAPAHQFTTATPSHPAKTAVSSRPLHTGSESGPHESARPILFPEFKFPIEGMKVETEDAEFVYEAKFTGELTMHREGVITGGVTFTPEGVESEYKKTASNAFNEMFTKSTVKYDGKKIGMELGIGGAAKLNGQTLNTTETTLVPPATVKFTMQSKEVKGVYKEYEFAGKIGFEVSVTKKKNPNDPHTAPQLVPVPVRSINWKKVAAVGLVATAAVIVIADIAKDIGTAGFGAAESPLSFAAAAELFGNGMAILRGAAVAAPAAMQFAH